MGLIASFSSERISIANFFVIKGLLGRVNPFFLFDTGAACSLVGVNNFFSKDENGNYSSDKDVFEKILRDEICSQGIPPRNDGLKTANNQPITAYPCVCLIMKIADVFSYSQYIG